MGETPFGWYFKNIFNNFPELISTTEEIKPSKIKTFKNCEISALFGEKTYFLDAFDARFILEIKEERRYIGKKYV